MPSCSMCQLQASLVWSAMIYAGKSTFWHALWENSPKTHLPWRQSWKKNASGCPLVLTSVSRSAQIAFHWQYTTGPGHSQQQERVSVPIQSLGKLRLAMVGAWVYFRAPAVDLCRELVAQKMGSIACGPINRQPGSSKEASSVQASCLPSKHSPASAEKRRSPAKGDACVNFSSKTHNSRHRPKQTLPPASPADTVPHKANETIAVCLQQNLCQV